MNRSIKKIGFVLAAMLVNQSIQAQETVTAITGARLVPVSGKPIEAGVMLIHRGKILGIGGSEMAIPKDALVIRAEGKTILPGLVDAHSHLGGPEGADNSAAISPETRALDAVNPTSDGFKKALAGGITTINVMPGSGFLMSGQTIYVKMRAARTVEDMLITNEKGLYGGLKMANGTNPMRNTAGFPGTRAKSAAMVRELFLKAREYQRKVQKAGKDSSKLPERDLRMEPLLEVLEGRRVVHFHTHKSNDIITAIRLSQEFGFKPVLHHVSEGWMVADEIAKAGLASSIISIDVPGGKMEAINVSLKTGAALEKAGAAVGFHTDDWITDSRLFLRSAAMMVRAGMSPEKAIEGLTLAGAKMLDLSSRIGTLEKGKDADFIILSGDPFSVKTKVEQTWVEGVKRYDIGLPEDRAFLVGGYDVYSPIRAEADHHKDDDH